MKHIKKIGAVKHKNSDTCTAYEYPFDEKALNTAFIEVRGRYPETGRALNEICTEIAHITSGNGKVDVDGQEITLEKGDQVLIKPNEAFFWEGDLEMVVSCSPAWNPDQYKAVE